MAERKGMKREDAHPTIRLAAKMYARLLFGGLVLIPAYLIAYVSVFQDPALRFENEWFREFFILSATLAGSIVTYMTWKCHQSSREPLLRWMTLAFLGFVLIHALPAAFATLAYNNTELIPLYGPASRFVMSALLFTGLLSCKRTPVPSEQPSRASYWLVCIAVFVGIDVLIALLADPISSFPLNLRLAVEGGAFLLSALNVSTLILRQISSPPIQIYGVSVAWFALASLAFILGRPSNQMWWLANTIFAGGFLLLSYGVVQAFRTTRSFVETPPQGELLTRLVEAMQRTESALREMQFTKQRLEHLAVTDPLTGAANRRKFIESVDAEIARARRGGGSFSVLALDLDNFKWVNDRYGHQTGDKVLQEFVQVCVDTIRPYDGVGRIGGEEFMVLLPQAGFDAALDVSDWRSRALRSQVRSKPNCRLPSVSGWPNSEGTATRSMQSCARPINVSITRSVLVATV
jgi:two-component system cell cycle response regulator